MRAKDRAKLPGVNKCSSTMPMGLREGSAKTEKTKTEKVTDREKRVAVARGVCVRRSDDDGESASHEKRRNGVAVPAGCLSPVQKGTEPERACAATHRSSSLSTFTPT